MSEAWFQYKDWTGGQSPMPEGSGVSWTYNPTTTAATYTNAATLVSSTQP